MLFVSLNMGDVIGKDRLTRLGPHLRVREIELNLFVDADWREKQKTV